MVEILSGAAAVAAQTQVLDVYDDQAGGDWAGFRLREPDGTPLGEIPRTVAFEFSDPTSDEGAIALSFARLDPFLQSDPGARLFDEEIHVEAWWNGKLVQTYVIEDYDDDATTREGASLVRFTGRTLTSVCERGIHVPDTAPISGRRQFTGTAPFAAWKTLFDEVVARGGFAEISTSITAGADSDAVAWATTEDFEVAPGADLLDLLKRYVGLTGADYRPTPAGVIEIRQSWGSDLSGTIIFETGYTLRSLRKLASSRRVRNAPYLEGKEGLISSTTDPTSITAWGRREVWVPAGDATSNSTRNAYLNASLEATKDQLTEVTVTVTTDRWSPWADYTAGDTVRVRSLEDGVDQAMRVVDIAVKGGADAAPTVELTLSSMAQDRITRLLRAMKTGFGLTDMVSGSVQFPAPVSLVDTIGELDTDQIAAGAITETKIAPDSISTPLIQTGAVVTGHMNVGSIDGDRITTGTLTVTSAEITSLEAGRITTGTITSGTITLSSTSAVIQSAGFVSGSSGWRIRGSGDAEFNSITVRNGAVIGGSITGSQIDIGGTDSTSFHVDTSGNMWLGAGSYASAPFKVSSAGAVTATSGTFSGNLSGAGGTFSGDISGASGTFTGSLSGATISGGSISIGANFAVNSSGDLVASNATITGSIVATEFKTAASGHRVEVTAATGYGYLKFFYPTGTNYARIASVGSAGSMGLLADATGTGYPQITLAAGSSITYATGGSNHEFIGHVDLNGYQLLGAGNITGTLITGTGLDINGNADISGTLAIGGNITAIGEYIYRTGNLRIHPSGFYHLRSTSTSQGYYDADIHLFRRGSGGNMVQFQYSAGYTNMTFHMDVPTLTGATTLVRTNTSRQVGLLSSSRRFKKNEKPIDPADRRARHRALKARQFRWDDQVYIDSGYDIDELPDEYGFIAEDVAEAFPEAVTYDQDGTPRSVKTDALVAVLWEEVEELRDRLDALAPA